MTLSKLRNRPITDNNDLRAAGSITQISASLLHNRTCAVLTSGGVQCWGQDYYDQVLYGALTPEQLPPVELDGRHGYLWMVAQISVGTYHTCALLTSGVVRCWGMTWARSDSAGAPGSGWTNAFDPPIGLGPVAQISAGYAFTCAVLVSGGARCWGANHYGKTAVPADLHAGGVAQISAGVYHACAVTTIGGSRCWGAEYPELDGDGRSTGENITDVPADLQAGGVAQISAGWSETCAVRTSGGVLCWGFLLEARFPETHAFAAVPADLQAGGVAQIVTAAHACVVTTAAAADTSPPSALAAAAIAAVGGLLVLLIVGAVVKRRHDRAHGSKGEPASASEVKAELGSMATRPITVDGPEVKVLESKIRAKEEEVDAAHDAKDRKLTRQLLAELEGLEDQLEEYHFTQARNVMSTGPAPPRVDDPNPYASQPDDQGFSPQQQREIDDATASGMAEMDLANFIAEKEQDAAMGRRKKKRWLKKHMDKVATYEAAPAAPLPPPPFSAPDQASPAWAPPTLVQHTFV